MIPDDFKQQLLSRVDIVDVIERHVQLRKAGQNYVARCPFHSEKTPSFSVSPAKQFYHCFGCGAHGSAISFVMEHGGLGYVVAVKELASMVGMTVPEVRNVDSVRQAQPRADLGELLLTAARYYKENLKRSEEAIAYLKQRGLSGEMAARFGLGYAPDEWQGLANVCPDYGSSTALRDAGLVIDAEGGRRYDRFRGRIMFPILNARGGIIGFGGRVLGPGEPKYLNSPETPLFEKGRELYGLFQARQAMRESSRAVVVEGYMDVVALAQHGFNGSVATLGTATTPIHVEKLLRLVEQVVFCFDGDAAGRRAAWRALEISLPKISDARSVSFLFLPEGEDPDTFVRAHGGAAFEACLRDAVPLSELLVQELCARVDGSTAEGRARLLHVAKPLVTQISAPTLALMLRRRLAEIAHVRVDDVDELFEVRRTAPQASRRLATESRARRAPASLTQWILQALLYAPQLASRVDRHVLDGSDRFYPALIAVLDLISDRPQLDAKVLVPMVLDAIRDSAVGALLREVQVELLSAPTIDFEVEFSHAIKGLREQAERRRLTELSTKQERSRSEQAEFESLLLALSQRAKQSAETIEPRV
jgi:DNA primase